MRHIVHPFTARHLFPRSSKYLMEMSVRSAVRNVLPPSTHLMNCIPLDCISLNDTSLNTHRMFTTILRCEHVQANLVDSLPSFITNPTVTRMWRGLGCICSLNTPQYVSNGHQHTHFQQTHTFLVELDCTRGVLHKKHSRITMKPLVFHEMIHPSIVNTGEHTGIRENVGKCR